MNHHCRIGYVRFKQPTTAIYPSYQTLFVAVEARVQERPVKGTFAEDLPMKFAPQQQMYTDNYEMLRQANESQLRGNFGIARFVNQ